MSTIKSFEDLIVWQKARSLSNFVYKLTKNSSFKKDYGLVDQIRRSSVSVTSNISEGFERGTKLEFMHSLFIAKGSCGEVRSQLYVAYDQGYIEKNDFNDAINSCLEVSRLIYSFIRTLKNRSRDGLQRKK